MGGARRMGKKRKGTLLALLRGHFEGLEGEVVSFCIKFLGLELDWG